MSGTVAILIEIAGTSPEAASETAPKSGLAQLRSPRRAILPIRWGFDEVK
jgi:hypothetical protein